MKKYFILLFLALLATAFNAYSATLQVTNSNDAGSGSLRERIANANSGDTIVFGSNVNYITLTSGQFLITKNLTISGGSGNTRITLDANNTSRIFEMKGDYTFNINNLTLTKGYAALGIYTTFSGGVLAIDSGIITFVATNCDFIQNHADDAGGVVYINDIYNGFSPPNATFIATNCIFSGNSANYGGAIFIGTNSTLTLTNCTFTENAALLNSGVISIYGSRSILTATNCTFTRNSANASYASGNGGAMVIYYGTATATNCTFTKNSANAGGAIAITYYASFYADNCIFSENFTTRNWQNNDGLGGAVIIYDNLYSNNLSFTATNCTFNKNSSTDGGAVYMLNGIFTAMNCTFNENSATNSGGAISSTSNFARNGTYLYHCTFDENQASSSGNAITNAGTLYSYNCVYTGNTPQIVGNVTAGDNLIEGVNAIVTRNYVFGTNQFNGRYITPLPNARAAKKLDNTIQVPAGMSVDEILNKLAKDQRGNPRPIE